jgi:hypothetical protein
MIDWMLVLAAVFWLLVAWLCGVGVGLSIRIVDFARFLCCNRMKSCQNSVHGKHDHEASWEHQERAHRGSQGTEDPHGLHDPPRVAVLPQPVAPLRCRLRCRWRRCAAGYGASHLDGSGFFTPSVLRSPRSSSRQPRSQAPQ